MKKNTLIPLNRTKCVLMGLVLAMAVIDARAISTPVNLGAAADFAVLAGSGITVTGPTTITGDIGTSPTPTITGIGNVTLNGVNRGDDAVTAQAKIDLGSAYNDIAGRAYDTTYGGGFDLVGLTLAPGVYNGLSSLFLSGTLTLDAQGDPDAMWVFQAGSTLITSADSIVALAGGAQAGHVFWQVGSSATLGTDTEFVGNILALTSITLNSGANVNGRVLARNGAVTLDNNFIAMPIDGNPSAVPDAGHTLFLLGFGLVTLLVFRQVSLANLCYANLRGYFGKM